MPITSFGLMPNGYIDQLALMWNRMASFGFDLQRYMCTAPGRDCSGLKALSCSRPLRVYLCPWLQNQSLALMMLRLSLYVRSDSVDVPGLRPVDAPDDSSDIRVEIPQEFLLDPEICAVPSLPANELGARREALSIPIAYHICQRIFFAMRVAEPSSMQRE